MSFTLKPIVIAGKLMLRTGSSATVRPGPGIDHLDYPLACRRAIRYEARTGSWSRTFPIGHGLDQAIGLMQELTCFPGRQARKRRRHVEQIAIVRPRHELTADVLQRPQAQHHVQQRPVPERIDLDRPSESIAETSPGEDWRPTTAADYSRKPAHICQLKDTT
jgi:hypothetical protein